MSNEGIEAPTTVAATEGSATQAEPMAQGTQATPANDTGVPAVQDQNGNASQTPEGSGAENQPANQEGTGDGGVQAEPTNLDEAMQRLNELQSEGNEEADKSGEQGSVQPEGQSTDGSADQGQTANNANVQGTTQPADNNDAGSPDSATQFNQQQYIANVNNAIEMQARQNAVAELQKAGVKLMEFNDLIHQEETPNGVETSFRNPDTGQEFPDRVAAQAWLDTQNNQVKAELNKLRNQNIQKIREQVGPAVQTEIFLKTVYPTLDESTKTVLNRLVDKDMYQTANGTWACRANLNEALKQAQSIVTSLHNGEQGSTQAMKNEANAAPTTPAVNMKTGGNPNGNQAAPEEPKDLNAAMAIINATKESDNNGK